MRRSVLERAAARNAAAAIVMANQPSASASDMYSALVVSSLRRLSRNVRISVQVVDPANREVVEDAGCDAIVSSSALLSAMLVRGVQDLKAIDVVHDLISSRGGSQIYRVSVPARLIGQRFRDYAAALTEKRVTPVALVRGREILTNPDPQLLLEAQDDAFVICRAPPALE